MFGLVTCANYTYELLAWLVFAIFTQTFTCTIPSSSSLIFLLLHVTRSNVVVCVCVAWLFFIVSALQIAEWSVKKHKAMKEEFGATGQLPKGRKCLVPFIF